MWDHIVFNTKIPEKKVVQNPEPTFGASKFPLKTLDQEFDSYNRPKQKIALLCGPPGLGKTTLAHVLAKHAGMQQKSRRLNLFSLF
jgi:chromosome transmission fidelity protein 18